MIQQLSAPEIFSLLLMCLGLCGTFGFFFTYAISKKESFMIFFVAVIAFMGLILCTVMTMLLIIGFIIKTITG